MDLAQSLVYRPQRRQSLSGENGDYSIIKTAGEALMCDPITFHDITPSMWAGIETKLKAAGIEVDHDQGTVYVGPTELQWDFDATQETVTVTCLHKLFILSCDAVYRKIEDLLQKTCLESSC